MRLSEAIRLGAMLKPQGFDGKYGRTSCALMAAAEAIGLEPIHDSSHTLIVNYARLYDQWPILERTVTMPPPLYFDRALYSAIYILNDTLKWTREQIADWVETIEQQHDAKLIETPVMASVAAQD